MEPEVRRFLTIIVQAMSMIVLWMMLVAFFGLKLGYLFPENGWGAANIICAVLVVLSFGWLLYYLVKKWKQLPRIQPDTD